MQISMTARHFELTESVKDFINTTCEHFSHYFENIIDVKVILDYNNAKTNNMSVSINVHSSGNDFRAEAEDSDLFKAVDICAQKIEAQLKKERKKEIDNHKNKKKNYSKRSRSFLFKKGKTDDNKIELEEKMFFTTPMETDDAINYMEENNLSYFVYRNTKTEKVDTVIKIDDEHYKIIEA